MNEGQMEMEKADEEKFDYLANPDDDVDNFY